MLRKTYGELKNYLSAIQTELGKSVPIISYNGGGAFRRTFFCFKEYQMSLFPGNGLLIEADTLRRGSMFNRLRGVDLRAPKVDLNPNMYLVISDDSLDLVPGGGTNEVPLNNDTKSWVEWLDTLPESYLNQEILLFEQRTNFCSNSAGFKDGKIGKSLIYFLEINDSFSYPASRGSFERDDEIKPNESIFFYTGNGRTNYCDNDFA